MKSDQANDQRAVEGAQAPRGSESMHERVSSAPLPHCRILISQDASRSLDVVSAKIADGFEGGRISRPQIVSWILLRFSERLASDDIAAIRMAYFDRIAYLEALLKRAKETGTIPSELNAITPENTTRSSTKRKPLPKLES